MSGGFDFWFPAAAGFIIGLCLGSFATMLSYRLPRRLSIVTPRSHCPVCKHQLTPRELVPVLSWVAQRGRCLNCAAVIAKRYPLIELGTAIATAAAFLLIGFSWPLIVALALIIAAVTAVTVSLAG